MTINLQNYLLLFIFFTVGSVNAMAQRVSFGTYATEGIILTPLNEGELNFNLNRNVIVVGQTATIAFNSDAVAALSIVARADLDITVTFDAPLTLDLDADNKVPLNLNYAYSNMGNTNLNSAKTAAIHIPAGFTSITFPMLKRASGLPPPPPIPGHIGYSPPTATAHVFIYGSFGPVPSDAAAGIYRGDINVRVEYTKY